MNKFTSKNITVTLIFLLLTSFISGCASTPSKTDSTGNSDPLEPMNRNFYTFNETLDKYLLKPVAQTYFDVTPQPVRTSITNFFDNLAYLNVILNSLLQGKFKQGFSDLGRFITNSTLGIAGLFDVATDIGVDRHNEDFGQTLAVWGVKQGAYLYIPLVKGPNTVRDTPDMATSTLLNPLTYVSGTVLFPITALKIINTRAELLDDTNIRDEAAVDPYSFTREAYLQRREFLIHDGNPPLDDYETIFEEESTSEPTLIIE